MALELTIKDVDYGYYLEIADWCSNHLSYVDDDYIDDWGLLDTYWTFKNINDYAYFWLVWA